MENSSLSGENDHRSVNDPSISLDRPPAGHSDTCKTRQRIIYRTPTNSFCVTDNNDSDRTSDKDPDPSESSTTTECKSIDNNNIFNCGDNYVSDTAIELRMSGQLAQESTVPECCLRDSWDDEDATMTANYDDVNNEDHDEGDNEGSSHSDCEEAMDHEMSSQALKADKLYLALYCNNCDFAGDSFTSKGNQKPNNDKSGSPMMDNYRCCCPVNKTSSKCINTNSSSQQPNSTTKLTINDVPLTPAVSKNTEQLKHIPVRLSTPVGILWTLLSIMVAGICSFSFLQPFWFTHPQTGNSFGMYSYCIRDTRHMPGMIQICGIYGGQFRFSNVPSHAWQAACVLYGGGCALLCFAALLAICSMCAARMCSKKIAICSGYIQLMAVLIMVGGLLVFPLGLDTRFFQHYCGRSAGPYNSADCQLGWGYMLAIMGTALSIFCPFLSQYTDMKVRDSSQI